MAGPTELTGVGGNLGHIDAPDYSPIGKAIGAIVAAHETKKQHAAQDFDRLMKAVDMGLPVDPKHIEKTLKTSGIKLMKPEDMKAFMEGQKNGTDPTKNSPTTGDQGKPTGAVPNDPTQAAKPTAAVAGAKQTQAQAKEGLLDGFVRNALHMSQMKNETAENQMKLQNKLSGLKVQAAGGDSNALGQLMALNEVPFNISSMAWQKGTPEQRTKMMDVARGAETESQFNARKDSIYKDLMAEGKFKDPTIGMKAAEIVAKGGEMPQDVRGAMIPNTFTDLVKQSQLANELVQMGVPPEQIGTVSTNAQLVGLDKALPAGINPLELRKVKAEETRTGVEIQRLQVETAHYGAMAAAANEKALEERSKADLEQFKGLVELKKLSPGAVTDDMITAAQTKAMKAMGWTKEETKGFWNYLTFGMIPSTKTSFRPTMSDQTRSNIDSSVGGKSSSDAATKSTVGAVAGAIKKQEGKGKADDGNYDKGEN